MDEKQLFGMALGVMEPWYIDRVEFDPEKRRLDLSLGTVPAFVHFAGKWEHAKTVAVGSEGGGVAMGVGATLTVALVGDYVGAKDFSPLRNAPAVAPYRWAHVPVPGTDHESVNLSLGPDLKMRPE